jgi:hypothetical protein
MNELDRVLNVSLNVEFRELSPIECLLKIFIENKLNKEKELKEKL